MVSLFLEADACRKIPDVSAIAKLNLGISLSLYSK